MTRSSLGARTKRLAFLFAALVVLVAQTAIPVRAQTDAEALQQYRMAEKLGQERLKAFDTLDFDVFTHQKWNRLAETHSPNIRVYWPDGHMTVGLKQHIADLKAMFVYAPDTRIETHPIRIASGDWTSVVGVLQGTFTRPMPGPNGTSIPPTGKAFNIKMVTIGHWKNGTMDAEYLFWDNLSFMKQLGLK